MRVKSDEKRQAIIDVAAQTFQELGFEGASMSEICSRVGGSKATLYNYFASKEDLFFEVMFQSADKEFEAVHDLLTTGELDVSDTLRRFGEGLMKILYAPEVVAARRLIIAESGRSELGRRCYERGPAMADALIGGFLSRKMELGKLRRSDPHYAACHFRGLLEAELYDRFMLGVINKISTKELKQIVERAVSVFMAAYGPVFSI